MNIKIKNNYEKVTVFWREYTEPNNWMVPISVNLIIPTSKDKPLDIKSLLTEKEIKSGNNNYLIQ